MDLEIREALALSDDRSAALGHLLPGSEDHDYYRALHAQHRGALDEVDPIIEAWPGRHGTTERLERLRLRQLLYRLGEDPASVADEVRDHFSVSHWHEAEVAEVDPTRPTRLAADAFSGERLLAEAVGHSSDLSQVTDEGIDELVDHALGANLDPSRRRSLLQRIGHTPLPAIVDHVVQDIHANNGFGSARAHEELTAEQLAAVANRVTKLRTDARWLDAVIRRMRPPAHVDLDQDVAAREAYIAELWRFVSTLPPAASSLKAHVLWHLLDAYRRRNAAPERALVVAYLQLPRNASYVRHTLVENVRPQEIAQLGTDFRATTGLPPAGSDEDLVRDLVHRDPDEATHYAPWIEAGWLDVEIAAAQLLYDLGKGRGSADRATHVLGPARAAALRERIDLTWCPHNPTRIGATDPIVLEADVKHVPELVVKVFRIDPLAYFQHHRREVNTDLDLDGLAASHELVMTFAEPAIRRVRRRIELPMCTRPGTYVIDLIGNGMSSRAVVHKGRLRHVSRIGAAGHVITVVDEAGTPQGGVRAWIGDREYRSDERGSFVVPFSTSPSTQPMLLSHGDLAVVRPLELVRETYALTAEIHLDRQSLADGVTARAVARVRLAVAGAPASVALLEQATWDVTLTDRHGIPTTKHLPLVLGDDDAAVLELPLGEAPAAVALTIRGKVKVVSEQRDEELATGTAVEIASMHGGTATEALYLAHTTSGWVVSALGKTGEPRPQRAITVTLQHRWARTELKADLATDAQGRCELGALPGVARITASLGGESQTWQIDPGPPSGEALYVAAGGEAVIALPPGRAASDVIRRASLVEYRGGAPHRHVQAQVEALAGAVVVRGLPPGDYGLRVPGSLFSIRVPEAGAEVQGRVISPTVIVELSRRAPVIADVAVREALEIRVKDATPRTRVHVIATRFFATPTPRLPVASTVRTYRVDRARPVAYVSGRELGDEYRYVLERRNAKRFPTLQLDKPSLLLNPWARKSTSTDIAVPRAGGVFAGAPAPAMAQGFGGAREQQVGRGIDEAYASHDFLAHAPVVLANLVPDERGDVRVSLAELGNATCVTIVVDDPIGSNIARVPLAETALETKDLRLRLALDPSRHAMQHKGIAPLRTGAALVIEDLATAKVHLVDSVQRAHAYLLALGDDATLREWSFVTRWHQIPDAERRELYKKYACHELHLFLYFKDRAFFDAVLRPYLVHKRTKTFIDHWLLDADLTPYLEPSRLTRLNAVERALLAQRLPGDPALVRLLADPVEVMPPDPARDSGLVDTLIGASRLDADSTIDSLAETAKADAYEMEEISVRRTATMAGGGPGGVDRAAPAAPPAPKKKAMKREADTDSDEAGMGYDLERRREAAAPMFRAADKTQEWAEHNWWHQTPADSNADLVAPNRFWRDLASHRGASSFLSPWLGLAVTSFAESMCALAVIDLPFVAGSHAITAAGPRLTIVSASNTLAGSSQIVDGTLVESGPPLVVGQTYVRADDRYRYVDGEQIDKYVDGAFISGVVYTCQVVLANPTSTRQRIAALVQIPKGSIALAGARATQTLDVVLEPYGTHGHEYSFYFPTVGTFTHFPVHVGRAGAIVAAAAARVLEVTTGGDLADPTSWAHVSQRGSREHVVAFLGQENLVEHDLEQIAWRLHDKEAYEQILATLDARHIYSDVLWGYSLLHVDTDRIRVWLRAQGEELLQAGPVHDMPIVGLDAEGLDGYEYLEYAPLTNARAHRLGPTLRILNATFAAQYDRFLELVAHRVAPTAEDLLAAAAYLLAQDRNAEALAAIARVRPDAIADRMQYDYLVAFAACLVGDTTRARELLTRWRQHPVDRWRHTFEALANMLAELDGAAPEITDSRSREQQQSDLAAKQPAFDISVDRDGVVLRQQHVSTLELRFFEMDVELLFSRQPFVQSDVSRFSFIEPGHRETLTELPAEHRFAWPAELRGKNVVVEAVGAGQRKAKIHYANDLATSVAHQYGQVRVQRASDRAPLVATYVKVYAQKRGGAGVAFYKDGYTDLRGWFDYATLSTNDLDHVERFAILICSDSSGAAILEAGPPAR